MRMLQVAFIAFTLVPLLGQSQKSTGMVSATTAEFKIPLQQHADQVWTWNRADTPDNDNEYAWTVTAKRGTAQYSFGFYLYKLPGSRESHGSLQELLKAGQNSVFKEDAEGHGELVTDARVEVAVENGSMLLRITNPELVRRIFGDHPATVAIHARTPAADYEVVPVTYQD